MTNWISMAWVALGIMLGTSISGAGFWAYDAFVDDPAVVMEVETRERASCAIRTSLAADLAREAETRRQKAAADAALEELQRFAATAESNRKLQVERLEQEIASYENVDDGIVCRISHDDLMRLQAGP